MWSGVRHVASSAHQLLRLLPCRRHDRGIKTKIGCLLDEIATEVDGGLLIGLEVGEEDGSGGRESAEGVASSGVGYCRVQLSEGALN